MKPIHKSIVVLILLSLSGCGKFLELSPKSQGQITTSYETASDIDYALMGGYDAIQQRAYITAQWMTGEVISDNTEVGSGSGVNDIQLNTFTFASNNSYVSSMWQGAYTGIGRVNLILDRIEPIQMNATLKNQYKGEALFLRAYNYFNLVRAFGRVPLITTGVDNLAAVDASFGYGLEEIPRIYTQIIRDLTEAGSLLPVSYPGASVGRVTQWAAKALLGKVYLQNRQFREAEPILKEVIDRSGRSLLPNFADNFTSGRKNSQESLFEIQFLSGGIGEGSPFPDAWLPQGSGRFLVGAGSNGGQGLNLPTRDLQLSFADPLDRRRDATIGTSYLNTSNNRVINILFGRKYTSQVAAALDGNDNFIVLRYADVLLMYAEALNENNQGPNADAISRINDVRARAGVAALRDLNYTTFRNALLLERRLEFAFENQRWYDLIRFGRAEQVMSTHISTPTRPFTLRSCFLYLPIPQSETELNPLIPPTRNECY